MLSSDQRVRFFVAMNGAWSVHCMREDIPPNDKAAKDTWYRAEMFNETGRRSVKDLNRTTDYDTMRLHWAIIADDESSIDYFGEAAERRLRKLIQDRMAAASQLTGRTMTWAYVRSIHDRMGLPLTLNECDTRILRKLLQALDTFVRRLRRGDCAAPDAEAEGDLPPPSDSLPF